MCKDIENSELMVKFLGKVTFKLLTKQVVGCWFFFLLLAFIALPIVFTTSCLLFSCVDTSTKGQLYQKLGKLPYCCTSLARQIKCFLQSAGPQEAVLGHWSSAGSHLLPPRGEERPLLSLGMLFEKQ